MIRKLKSGEYRLYSRKLDPKTHKRRNLGTFSTRAAAEKHEREVQYFKRHCESRSRGNSLSGATEDFRRLDDFGPFSGPGPAPQGDCREVPAERDRDLHRVLEFASSPDKRHAVEIAVGIGIREIHRRRGKAVA